MKRPRADRDELSIRRPPGFMEYGSDLLALERVKLMALGERGLLATMRWYVWANDTLPREPALMARLLGLEAAEVQASLTERVLSFFAPAKGDPQRLICPELHAQMERLMTRREKMLQGTLNSHKARREQGKTADGTQGGSHDGTHRGSRVASELNRTEPNCTALGKEADEREHLKGNGTGGADPFIADYEAAEARERAGG